MQWWVWVVFGFVLLAFELLTPGGFYILFFGVGAIVVGILTGLGLGGPAWLQWLLFSVVSVTSLLLFRRRLVESVRSPLGRDDTDSLVGTIALTLEDLAVGAIGKVETRGATWNARNVGSQPLARRQRCRVERLDGLMLQVSAE